MKDMKNGGGGGGGGEIDQAGKNIMGSIAVVRARSTSVIAEVSQNIQRWTDY